MRIITLAIHTYHLQEVSLITIIKRLQGEQELVSILLQVLLSNLKLKFWQVLTWRPLKVPLQPEWEGLTKVVPHLPL